MTESPDGPLHGIEIKSRERESLVRPGTCIHYLLHTRVKVVLLAGKIIIIYHVFKGNDYENL